MDKLSELSEAIREVLTKAAPLPDENGHTQINVGPLLDDAFKLAGWTMELHQHGIQGTSVIAVKN